MVALTNQTLLFVHVWVQKLVHKKKLLAVYTACLWFSLKKRLSNLTLSFATFCFLSISALQSWTVHCTLHIFWILFLSLVFSWHKCYFDALPARVIGKLFCVWKLFFLMSVQNIASIFWTLENYSWVIRYTTFPLACFKCKELRILILSLQSKHICNSRNALCVHCRYCRHLWPIQMFYGPAQAPWAKQLYVSN